MSSLRCPLCAGAGVPLLLLAVVALSCRPVVSERFLMGYLTGSERTARDQEYPRPGRMISGAINLAMHEITTSRPLVNGECLPDLWSTVSV